jgi:hypothetical protein
VSIPDLDLTVRLVGLPIPELWGRYLAVGGSSTLLSLTERIAGRIGWPPEEELFLAVALSDALIDESLVALNPLAEFLAAASAPGRPPAADRQIDDTPVGHGAIAAGTAIDIAQLIVRAHEARASARRIRRSAQAARQRVATSTYGVAWSARPPTLLDG